MQPGTENQFAIRASRRNRLVVLAGLLAVIMITNSVIGLFALNYGNENYLGDLKHLDRLAVAVGIARGTQVHFKKQVQEWKNILLRGSDPAGFTHYRAAFDDEERQAQKGLQDLSELVQKHQIALAGLEQVQKDHKKIGTKYRDALRDFRPAASDSALAADKQVRGIDRELSDQMDAMVDQIESQAGALLNKVENDTDLRYHTLRRILTASTAAGVIVVLVFLGLTFAALPRD